MTKGLKPIYLLLYFLLSLLFMELLLKVSIGGAIFSIGFLLSLLFSASFAIIFYIITRLFQPTVNYVLSILLLSVTTIIYASQFIYFKFFKTFYTVYSAGNAGQVAEFWKDIFSTIFENAFIFIAFFIPVIYIAIFGRKLFQYKKMRAMTFFAYLSSLCFIYLATIALINISGKENNSAYDLYYFSNSPVLSVKQLGMLTTMRLDLQRQLTNWTPTYQRPVNVVPEQEPHKPDPDLDTDPGDKDNKPKYVDQIMEIDFESLIVQEENDVIKDMHRYFKSLQPSKTNAFTGKFEGYNLIFITAEGFSHFAIDKNITPTLYKLANEGYQFTDFYTPIWGVSTSDGEYVATQGLIPKSGVWSFYESGKNYLPFVMGNQLKQLGYKTVAYHNHTFDYYRRDVSHPNMGYEYKAVGNGLNVKETWPESDIEMLELTIPEYIDQEPFHAYYMTVSGHMLYTFTGNYIAYKNKDLVDGLSYSEEARAYLATQIELDRALEHLLTQLEEAGVLDHTLIALSADHYPYGLDKKTIDEFAGHTVDETFELYKNAFLLYTPGMEPVKVSKPASSLDIIPTLSNLLGLEYDSRLLMGKDLMSNDSSLVIFQDRSFITDKGKFNSVENKFYPNKGVEIDQEYINRMQAIVNSKFYYSAMILDHDYYSKILKSN